MVSIVSPALPSTSTADVPIVLLQSAHEAVASFVNELLDSVNARRAEASTPAADQSEETSTSAPPSDPSPAVSPLVVQDLAGPVLPSPPYITLLREEIDTLKEQVRHADCVDANFH